MTPNVPDYYNCSRPEVVGLFDPKGLRVLDVGCAAGAMGELMLQRGAAEVVGIERDPVAARMARTRLSAVFQGDLDTLPTLPYPDGAFDVITCADVLEHLVDPGALLRHLRRYLRDGGRLVTSIPNIRHQSVLLPLLVHGRFTYVDAGILDRTHLRFFTLVEYLAFLKDSGFRPAGDVGTVGNPPSPELERVAQAVSALGGDPAAFKREAQVIQYLVVATPSRPLAELGLPANPVPPRAVANQWSGSKTVRVLLAPDLARPDDAWLKVLAELTSDPAQVGNLTVGIAVSPSQFEPPPAGFAEFAQSCRADLLLTEAPADLHGWERLLAGASLYVDTARRTELASLARRVGVQVLDSKGNEQRP